MNEVRLYIVFQGNRKPIQQYCIIYNYQIFNPFTTGASRNLTSKIVCKNTKVGRVKKCLKEINSLH